MRLSGASSWIEWLIASPAGKSVEVGLPTRADWLVPTIVQLELAKWLVREVGEDKADQVVAFTQMCLVVPLDTKIALAAAEICSKHKLATADAIVYSTALEYEAAPLTSDPPFGHPPAAT